MANCYLVKEIKTSEEPQKPKKDVLRNILDFSKSLEVKKSKNDIYVEVMLN